MKIIKISESQLKSLTENLIMNNPVAEFAGSIVKTTEPVSDSDGDIDINAGPVSDEIGDTLTPQPIFGINRARMRKIG